MSGSAAKAVNKGTVWASANLHAGAAGDPRGITVVEVILSFCCCVFSAIFIFAAVHRS